MRRLARTLLIPALVAAALAPPVLAQEEDDDGAELVLLLEEGTRPDHVARRLGGELIDSIPALNAHLVAFETEPPSEDAVLAERGVLGSEENARVHGVDCLQSEIWLLERGSTLDLTETTEIGTVSGRAARVAVLDGAFDADHVELRGAWLGGRDMLDGDGDPTLSPSVLLDPEARALAGNVHGTAVASALLRAAGSEVELTGYRVLDEDCIGGSFILARALVQAVDDGAEVVLLSLGSHAPSGVVQAAIIRALARDVVVVAAAGNDGGLNLDFPASFHLTAAVAAVDADGLAAPFTAASPQVDLADVGVDLRVAAPGDAEAIVSGTSFSAARTAAAAAVLRARSSELSAHEVLEILQRTAAPLAETRPSLIGKLGAGRTDLPAALGGLTADGGTYRVVPLSAPSHGRRLPGARLSFGDPRRSVR